VVVDKMLAFEDDNDESAQDIFLGHCQRMAGGDKTGIRSVMEAEGF
jgi:hypothetical protein